MNSKLAPHRLRALLFSCFITLVLFNSCQKEELFGIDPQPEPWASLVGEGRLYFEQNILRSDHRLQARPQAKRHRVSKVPLWDRAEKVQLSIGEALKVPLAYGEDIQLLIGPNKTAVPLAELTYLLLYKNQQQHWKAEVVTQVPDAEYWAHRQQLNRPFSGIIIVEDWWGKPIRTFKKLPQGQYVNLNNPLLWVKPGEKNHNQPQLMAPADCKVKVETNSEGMYEVEYICDGPDNGGGGGNDGGGGSGEGGWGDGGIGGPGGGGGGNGPGHGDYEERPRGGGGGGGRRNDNPPEPPISDITTPEEFLAEIDDSRLSQCLRNVLAGVKNLSQGSVAGIIQKFAGEVPGYNWKIIDAPLSPNVNANTETLYDRNTGTVTTKFDPNKFKNASDLAVARTIIHESIHAYLVALFNQDRNEFRTKYPELYNQYEVDYSKINNYQHSLMTQQSLQDISLALKEFALNNGYVLDGQYFSDMAWGGLTIDLAGNPTNYFLQMVPSNSDRQRILNLLSAEQTGYDLNNQFKGTKGSSVNCITELE